jgi:3-deoxy-D-manno-octulosonic-acid transferase
MNPRPGTGLRGRATILTWRAGSALASVFTLPWWLARDGGWWGGTAERYGFLSARTVAAADPAGSLWFHAASVGEVGVLARVLPGLASLTPELPVVVSTVTATGRARAAQLMGGEGHRIFLPLDAVGPVRRTLRSLHPHALVIAETELWPNLLREASRNGCALVIINGRLSERAHRRYRLVRQGVAEVLGRVDLLCVKTSADAGRFIGLGARPERVHVTGDLKSEPLPGVAAAPPAERRAALGLSPEEPLLVAGSTREGEESVVLAAFEVLLAQQPDLRLVIAPRYPHRARSVVEEIRASGRPAQLRTEAVSRPDESVLVLDTIGELERFYAAASVAFVGGSLVPVGGHNLLEPALYGVPVLFGPYTGETGGADRLLLAEGGGFRVEDAAGLATAVNDLLVDPERRAVAGKAAQRAVAGSRGALERVLGHYRCLMGLDPPVHRVHRTDRGSRGIREEDRPGFEEAGE